MKRFEYCDCDMCYRYDFRCAVQFVVNRFGIDPNCECRAADGPLCVKCEVRGDREKEAPSPLPAFQAARPPYRGLAGVYSRLARTYTEIGNDGIVRFRTSLNKAAVQLLEASHTDPLAYDAALWLVAECVRSDVDIPDAIREWAFFAITGQIERHKLKGKYPPAHAWRDREIVGLVRDVRRIFWLKATAAGDEGGQSACAAVATALGRMRLQPDSYPTIRRIWRRRHKPTEEPSFTR